MAKRLLLLALTALLLMIAGCSNDENGPTGSVPQNTAVSTWVPSGQMWRSVVDGSSHDHYTGFSFTTNDTVTAGLPKVMAGIWDIAFQRDAVKLNGGASSDNGGDVVAMDLGAVDFDAVTIADTAGKSWTADQILYYINDWYDYNPVTHQLTANRNVWSMIDAEGDNYVKFQVDSMVGAGMPPDMGTVYLKYFYQSTAGSTNLSGTGVEVAIPVNSARTYFDFSSGSVVSPGIPDNSTDWDIFFYSYEIGQNGGINGSGDCGAFPAFGELADQGEDPFDFDAFVAQPAGAPMFPDIANSVLTDWYNYTGPPSHQLLSKNHVYLLQTAGEVYKLQIESYYSDVSGVPTSGWYTFVWKQM